MTDEESDRGSPTLPPNEAFSVLGNETRMEILRTLGESDEPLPFSELKDRVGIRDSGQFNYHLSELRDHFLSQDSKGYSLRRSGERVIQAVLSGAVSDAPVVAPTEIDEPCVYCGAPTLVSSRAGDVSHYCTECPGTYGRVPVAPEQSGDGGTERERLGFLGKMVLPPAGIQGRTPTEVYETTTTWGAVDILAIGRGICPQCSAAVEQSLRVCEDHDSTGRACERCENHHAILCETTCTNCTVVNILPLAFLSLSDPAVMAFLAGKGVDPVSEWASVEWSEELTGSDPFEAQFRCTVGEETLVVTVDDTPSVVDVEKPSQ